MQRVTIWQWCRGDQARNSDKWVFPAQATRLAALLSGSFPTVIPSLPTWPSSQSCCCTLPYTQERVPHRPQAFSPQGCVLRGGCVVRGSGAGASTCRMASLSPREKTAERFLRSRARFWKMLAMPGTTTEPTEGMTIPSSCCLPVSSGAPRTSWRLTMSSCSFSTSWMYVRRCRLKTCPPPGQGTQCPRGQFGRSRFREMFPRGERAL